MVLWRLSQAVTGGSGKDHQAAKRAGYAGRCVFYAAAAWSVLSFAAEGRQPRSGDQQSRDATATVLAWPMGQWLVVAAGCVLVGAGIWIGVRAGMLSFRKKPRDSLAVVGSANMDMRSLFLNYEVAVYLYSRPQITAIADWVESLMAECVCGLPSHNRLQALAEDVVRLLSPLL